MTEKNFDKNKELEEEKHMIDKYISHHFSIWGGVQTDVIIPSVSTTIIQPGFVLKDIKHPGN